MSLQVIHPASEQDWQQYYLLRWEILRKPWNQPKILQPVEGDDTSTHFLAKEGDVVLGVCRLHFNNPEETQVRFVGVATEAQGKGVGKAMMEASETYALQNGAKKMVLHARENAVPFYKSIGYTIVEESYLLFDEIQHYLMEKKLS